MFSRKADKLDAVSPITQQAISATPTYIILVVFHVYSTVFNGNPTTGIIYRPAKSGYDAQIAADAWDNWQNFMNYSSQYANFTTQQVSRMITALNVPSRVTLWSASNLTATGTN